jgi:hypothetical protein
MLRPAFSQYAPNSRAISFLKVDKRTKEPRILEEFRQSLLGHIGPRSSATQIHMVEGRRS